MIFNYYSRLVFITIIVPLAVQIFGYMRKVVHSPCSPFLRRLDYLVQTFGYIWTIYFYLSKFMDISGLVRFVQVFGPFWQHPYHAAQLSLAVLLGFRVLRNRRIERKSRRNMSHLGLDPDKNQIGI